MYTYGGHGWWPAARRLRFNSESGYMSRVVVTMTILCVLAQQPSGVDGFYWGSFAKDDCITPGYMKYYSRLWDIPSGMDWTVACLHAEAWITGIYFRQPANCVDKGIGGMWGEWKVRDTSCDPQWGSFKDDGCNKFGCHQYSSILWNIPYLRSWEKWCANSWADIKGRHFNSPTRCVNTGLNMWGEFDLADYPMCGHCYPYNVAVAGDDHGDFGGLPTIPPFDSPSLAPSDSPSESPSY